ncbi:MAG: hypothetical protein HYS89_00160 [Candidatus Colwellbacteria bacterium]|nr:hypothetical protein [Candidatus Colwellbacteria bacterium]
MALVFGEERKKNWKPYLIGGGVLILLVVLTYYLFFAPAPLAELTAPPEFEKISKVSKIELNPNLITNDQVYKSLRRYIDEPVTGEFGRPNPFAPF